MIFTDIPPLICSYMLRCWCMLWNLSCQLQDINKEKVCVSRNAIMFTWNFMQVCHMAQHLKDKANSTMIPLAYSVSNRNKAGWSPNMKFHTCSFKKWYFHLNGTLGILQPNTVECGEHYSSSSTHSNTLHGFKRISHHDQLSFWVDIQTSFADCSHFFFQCCPWRHSHHECPLLWFS